LSYFDPEMEAMVGDRDAFCAFARDALLEDRIPGALTQPPQRHHPKDREIIRSVHSKLAELKFDDLYPAITITRESLEEAAFMPLLRPSEFAALAVGLRASRLHPSIVERHQSRCRWLQQYFVWSQACERAVEAGALAKGMKLEDWMRWARTLPIPLSPILIEHSKEQPGETAPKERALGSQERKTLLLIINAMATGRYGFNPRLERSSVPREIANEINRIGEAQGDSRTEKTVLEKLREAHAVAAGNDD